MYGSYGSYSSTPAMEIPSRRTTYHSSSQLDASCAFPSWPRRDSLTDDRHHTSARVSSYISDEDLQFLSEPVFADDDARSVASSSCGSGSGTPSPRLAPIRHVSEEQIERMRREQALRQQEYLRVVMNEKEQRRRQAKAAKAKKAAAAARKGSVSPKTKLSSMTPITEALE